MSTGLWVALAAIVVAVAFGSWRAATDGRFKRTDDTDRAAGADGAAQPALPVEAAEAASLLAGTPWQHQLGERATFLQFSSAFCAPCRATRRVLSDVVAERDGVAHVEVDAEQHLDVVRRLHITRTPTTIVLDGQGRELGRAVGAPTRDQVLASVPGLT